MRQLILVAAMAITFGTTFAAQPEVTRYISREAAIKVLRDGGILWGKTRVVSAEWGSNTREWLVTLQHPDGKLSAWFVDAAGQDYHGGPCKH
ncbi:MAG TPA: hypothetical protein VGM62_03905 [Chthoniobacterales bacterium]